MDAPDRCERRDPAAAIDARRAAASKRMVKERLVGEEETEETAG